MLSYTPFLTLTSVRQTLGVGPKGVHLKESGLYLVKNLMMVKQLQTKIQNTNGLLRVMYHAHCVESFLTACSIVCEYAFTQTLGGAGITARDLLYCEWFFYQCLLHSIKLRLKVKATLRRSLRVFIIIQEAEKHCQMKEQRQSLLSYFKALSVEPANNNKLHLTARN